MDIRKANEMIERQRRRWRSQDPDLAIARRAERVYFALAMGFFVIGISLSLIGRGVLLIGFLVGAFLFLLHSRRFAQIQKLLVNSAAKTDAH